MKNFRMVAKTFAGLEDLLAGELRKLGAGRIKVGIRSVTFEGDLGFMYKANLSLRTALRILRPIAEFKAKSEEDFYRKVYQIDWSGYLEAEGSFAIDATVHSEQFTHSQYVMLKAKDAIVDQFRNQQGKRPNIDVDHPDVRINVRVHQQDCTVSLDSSGDSLHKRGYKKEIGIAPINEVLAAGLLLHSRWEGTTDFLDPMCGSGTILVEAAMIACHIPPNLNRPGFGFQSWKNWDPDLYEVIQNAQLNKIKEFHFQMVGYDKSPEAVRIAQQNIAHAGLSDFIKVERKDFFVSKKYSKRHLHLLFNPPYGERMRINVPLFYKNIGDTLKQYYPDSEAWMITSEKQAIKSVGLRTSRKIKVFNGPLEARLLQYEIYKGSKKKRKRIPRKK